MKILFVSNLYGDNARGGAERIAAAEANALAAAGHEVTVVSAGRHEAVSSPVGAPGVIRYVAPNLYFYADDHQHGLAARFAWHLLDIFHVASARRFAAILREKNPDVVHTHNLMGLGFLLPGAIRRSKTRHVHTVHDVQLLHPSGLLRPDAGRPWYARLAQAAYIAIMLVLMGSPDVVIFPSKFLADLHRRYGFFRKSKIQILVNPAPVVGAPRIPPPVPHFVFAGQIERHKGVFLLLEAWNAAKLYAMHGATLEYVGEGTAVDALRTAAATSQGVTLAGKLSGDALTAAYDRATCVVAPSLIIENQPTVILEAMSRGTPVIGAAVGGIPELVMDSAEPRTGFLFPPGDAPSLSALLRRMADLATDRPNDWRAMSNAGRAWAHHHGIASHMAALLASYDL